MDNSAIISGEAAEAVDRVIAELKPSQVAVLTDRNTRRWCYPLLKAGLPRHSVVTIPAGEPHKHLGTCQQVWQHLTDKGFDRHGLLLNLGGGVVGDLGGFCAATYKRGIRFVQIPTTLLAQTDAAVGGKVGVDFAGLKNHLGAFALPAAVILDVAFLQTLPERELRSGFAEALKHCLIADAAAWETVRKRDWQQQNWQELVMHSVAVKDRIVQLDPQEKGIRKVLNFGHTLGHAIESYYLAQPRRRVLHGEAIAAGMIAAAWLSHQKVGLAAPELAAIEEYIFAAYGSLPVKKTDIEAIVKLTLQDKKNRSGQVLGVLLEKIGQPVFDQPLRAAELAAALRFYSGHS